MKKVLMAALALVVLGARSTMNSSYHREADMDLKYVAYVEHWAKQFGTKVHWVNVPRKQPDATQ